MITKMKKFTFLVYHKEYDEFLKNLRELGVVHVVEKMQGEADNAELKDSIQLSTRLSATIKMLTPLCRAEEKTVSLAESTVVRGYHAADHVDKIVAKKEKQLQTLQTLIKEREQLEPWGDFESTSINQLTDTGYRIGFYLCNERYFDVQWVEQFNAIRINQIGSTIYFITVMNEGAESEIEAEEAKLPKLSITELDILIEDTRTAIKRSEEMLGELAMLDMDSLKLALKETHASIEFSKVVLSTEQAADNKLMMFQGWAPAARMAEIKNYLQKENAYFEITDPTPEDNVPIELSNTGFFRLFEPICKLYMLPKYNELDLTPFFAPFFMLFFGLCLGDSGYGLFMLLGVTIYRMVAKNVSATMKPLLTLVQILGVSTMICGLLTGTFFGFALYDIDLPFFKKMKSIFFFDNSWMFNLSLILGAIQIIFGMILKAVNQTIQLGFKYAVATIGWILLLLSCVFAFLLPNLLPMGGTSHLIVLGVCGVMIFLLNSPGKNPLLNIGLGLWDSYNMATGLLGDVLSYIRLFALGLSGGILASVFNSLAVGMSPDIAIIGPIVMIIIFLIGHSINIFMNVLGAMVHPMRLTFVEFFKNSGYEGGGKEYKPFKN